MRVTSYFVIDLSPSISGSHRAGLPSTLGYATARNTTTSLDLRRTGPCEGSELSVGFRRSPKFRFLAHPVLGSGPGELQLSTDPSETFEDRSLAPGVGPIPDVECARLRAHPVFVYLSLSLILSESIHSWPQSC